MLKSLIVSAFLVSALSGFGQIDTIPQKTSDSTNVKNIDEVIIRVDDLRDRKNSTLPKLIIEAKDYEKFEYSTVGEILRTLPGMVFDKGNESKDVKFRGLDKEYTQILIDGERIPDGGEKREFQVDRIPVSMIERIEIIRSPMPNLDGQGVAGTVNIIMKKPKYGKITSFNHSLGQTEAFGKQIDVYFQYGERLSDKFNFIINGGFQSRLVPKSILKETYDSTSTLLNRVNEEEHKKYIEANYAPRMIYKINAKHQFSLDPLVLYSQENREKSKITDTPKPDGTFNSAPEDENEFKDRIGWSLRGTYTYSPNDRLTISYRPIYQKNKEIKEKSVVGKTSTGLVNKREEETELKYDTEFINRVTVGYLFKKHQKFSIGVEHSDKSRSKEKTSYISGIEKPVGPKDFYTLSEQRVNGWIMDEINVFSQHFFVPGVRFEYTENTTTSRQIMTIPIKDTLYTTLGGFFKNANPSLHYTWKSNYNLNLRASAAKNVRRPKFDDLIPYTETKGGSLTDPDIIGNPELRPEISIGYEFGVDKFFEYKRHKGFGGINTFYRSIEDKMESAIYEDTNGRYVSQVQNIGQAETWGYELDAKYTFDLQKAGLFSVKGNYTRMFSEVRDLITGSMRKLKGQPDYVFNCGLDYTTYKNFLTIGANYNFISPIDENETKANGTYEKKMNSPVQRLDFFVGFNFKSKYSIRLSGQNFMNVDKAIAKEVYLATGQLEKIEYNTERFYRSLFISLQINL